MADYPFADEPQSGPGGGNVAQASAEWANAMSDPNVRGALLQFGISMLQPPQFGDTFGSKFGQAVGAAGERQSRLDEEERKRLDSESKDQLRQSQAATAESRALTAQTQATTAQERLANQKDRDTLSNIIRRQGRQIQATGAYQKYVKEVEARNNDLTKPRGSPKEPVLNEQDFYKKFGYEDLLRGVGSNAPASTGQREERIINGVRYYKGDDGNWYTD